MQNRVKEAVAFIEGMKDQCKKYGFLPDTMLLNSLLKDVIAVLSAEPAERRPHSPASPETQPGGLVRLSAPYVLLIPDVHARLGFLVDVLSASIQVEGLWTESSTIMECMNSGLLEIVCLGDILHGESASSAQNWISAAEKYARDGRDESLLSSEMDTEMGMSLAALLLVMKIKVLFPESFHCLKGNHDNMSNSSLNGDFAFYKYAREGSMGAAWFRLRYGDELMLLMRTYEQLLPLVVSGTWFCASHAEPWKAVSLEDLLNYRERPDVVTNLIWTGNGYAEKGSVQESLAALISDGSRLNDDYRWFSGHRPVLNRYSLRQEGRLVQIHSQTQEQVVLLDNSLGKDVSNVKHTADVPKAIFLELEQAEDVDKTRTFVPMAVLPPLQGT